MNATPFAFWEEWFSALPHKRYQKIALEKWVEFTFSPKRDTNSTLVLEVRYVIQKVA